MRRMLGSTVIVAALMAPVCRGQSMQDMMNFKGAQVGGVRLYNLSVFGGYSSSAAAPWLGSITSTSPGALAPDINYGAAAVAGWQHHGERTNAAVMYSGTYMGMARYTELNAYNQAASLDINRNLTSKWTIGISGTAQDNTLAQYLFQPLNLGVISGLSRNFDDLAAAFSVGRFTNSQAATMLTGSPILDTPLRTMLLGNRILSASVQASLIYNPSSRVSVRFGSFAAGAQKIKGPQADATLPSSRGINAGVSLSYALSPRTEVGVDVGSTRISNSLQRGYVTTASGSWGRKMGPRWFLRFYGGGSHNRMDTTVSNTPQTFQAIGGASIGFQTLRHTFVLTANHSSMDTFGIIAAKSTDAGGTWSWRPSSSGWRVFSNATYQQMTHTAFQNLSGWRAGAGVSRQLGAITTLSMEYSCLTNTGIYSGFARGRFIHGVRVSLSWAPELGIR